LKKTYLGYFDIVRLDRSKKHCLSSDVFGCQGVNNTLLILGSWDNSKSCQ
jgi:hypothetical protein